MSLVSGNRLLVDTLIEFGVDTVFTLHGGHLDGIYSGLIESGIRLVDTRHEQAAGFAAQGHAKVTGGVGVAMATAGGGITNLTTPIANAWSDGVPVVFLGGAPPLRDFDSLPVNSGYDQLAIMTGITKWAHRATVTEMLPQVIARAFQIAASGRPGPVYVDLPTDVLFARVERDTVTIPRGHARPQPPAAALADVKKVVALLEKARHPVIVAGGGTVFPDASGPLRELAERFGLPVLTNNKSKGVVPTDDAHAGGSFGSMAAVAKRTGKEADFVLMLGARFGLYTGGRRGSVVPDAATVVQVDAFAEEIGRMRDIDLGLTSAVLPFVEAVLENSGPQDLSAERQEWLAAFGTRGSTVEEPQPDAKLTPAQLGRRIAALAPDDTIFVLDGGETPAWLDAVVPLSAPRRWIGHGYMGIMGEGLPQAVGAQVAAPDSPVICFSGDGAIGYALGEFDTLARQNLPVIVVVNNDQGWAMSQHGQDLIFGEGNRIVSDLAPSRYDQVAAAFGVHAEFVEHADQFDDAFRRALDARGPACINVLTDSTEIAGVTKRFIGEIVNGPVDENGRARVPYAEFLAV